MDKLTKNKLFILGLLVIGLISSNFFVPNIAIASPQQIFAANYSADCSPGVEGEPLNTENCGIIAYVVLAINVLSGLVGIIIVMMLVYSGIRYTTARDDPQAVSNAKSHIRDAIIALIFYLVAFAFLQWLVPGGAL